MTSLKDLPYDATQFSRELKKYYITASKGDCDEMLKVVGAKDFSDLFTHIPSEVLMKTPPALGPAMDYLELINQIEKLAQKNHRTTSFIGDGLKNYQVHPIVPFVSDLRGLSTAYTSYQPERGQGTLTSLWLYSCVLSMLTGFEAINASMYDRSTALYEALLAATRLTRGTDTVLVCESLYPGDWEVLKTLAQETFLKIIAIPLNPQTGLTDLKAMEKFFDAHAGKVGGIAFPQVNSLGNLEDVHAFTDFCSEKNIQSIAVIDPMLISTGGLIPPAQYGSKKQGANMLVAEGQHLAIAPNFSGPGLGIFGIRFNDQNKNAIRSTPGRYVGKGKDTQGREALLMVLSTREQHIRREKATSNICSNQAFIATLAGAAILGKGEQGMSESCLKGQRLATQLAPQLGSFEGVELAFPQTAFFNEFTLKLPLPAQELIQKAQKQGLQIGVDVSSRVNDTAGKHLLLSFFDLHTQEDVTKLLNFFSSEFKRKTPGTRPASIPANYLRSDKVGLPQLSLAELKKFYSDLSNQNVSPDDQIYPLGSCTMKYNPLVNDYLASLPGFTELHPQSPLEDCQGSLQILFEIQDMFKKITGLSAITTQPVAGAQGELCGIKMIQAYHRDHGEGEKRNILLIPHSAHGTNPATAAMAGFETKVVDGVPQGIMTVEANEKGQIDFPQLQKIVTDYGPRIAGVMVTNPNTCGLFETQFKEMADLIHS
ncbi:MAG: glycine dehydrogenase, partial [Pseudomonadota bacterium]